MSVAGLNLRIAGEGDRAVWMALRCGVYTDCEDAFHEEDINIWLRDADKVCFIAEWEGKVDGCLSSPVGYLEGICVFPDYRGRGISKELIAMTEQWMKDQGCTEMGSDAELHNEEAIRFHKALGFVESYRVVQFRKALE